MAACHLNYTTIPLTIIYLEGFNTYYLLTTNRSQNNDTIHLYL